MALLPVLLISMAVITKNFYAKSDLLYRIIVFVGDPVIALLLSLIAVMIYTFFAQRVSVKIMMDWLHEAVTSITIILLIITAGGIFKQVITDSGTAEYIASFAGAWHIHPLIFAWTVTALLRVIIGSATVAALTAAALVTPLLMQGYTQPELLVLAVGTGSVFGSHVNDSGFWMFREFFGLSLKQTFLSWTLMESLISIMGLGGVLLLSLIV
jgi:Gnt-I system high-affinity gluconate transporter